MRNFQTFFLVLLVGGMTLLSMGCTHTHRIRNTNVSQGFDRAHEVLEGRSVNMELRDGRVIPSTIVRINPDTTWAIDVLTGRLRPTANRNVEAVMYRQPGKGIVQGALIGTLLGGLAGLGGGIALTAYRDPETAETGILQYVGVVVGFGVVVGSTTGAFIGGMRTSRSRYIYPAYLLGATTPDPPAPIARK